MITSPLSDSRIRVLFLISWLLLALLQAHALCNAGFSWQEAAVDSAITNFLLFGTCLLISNSLRYYRPEKEKSMYILIWCLILATLAILINYHLLSLIFSGRSQYLVFLGQTIPLRFGVALVTISWMTMVSLLWHSLQDRREHEKRKADAEKMAKEAELYKLRQQLQPHFLFNSLNSISALIGTRPAEARKMIHQLSDFLRGTLRKEEQWVSLKEELENLQLYLDIEKVRFGHRLSTCIECDENCDGLMLPPLLLQPVVENAIKFGLYDTTEAVTIVIRAYLQYNLLVIAVQNPFDKQTSSPRHGTGFGLSSIQRRLYLLFARNDLLETKTENDLFTTIIKIPQK